MGSRRSGIRSPEAPNEDRYVYKALPDVVIQTVATAGVRLSTVWRDRPVSLTMIFTRCAGVCSPFLRSLKGAAADAEGLGRDYRIVVLSFDPQDTAADMDRMGESLGVKSDPAWIFGVASPSDIRRLAAARRLLVLLGSFARAIRPSVACDRSRSGKSGANVGRCRGSLAFPARGCTGTARQVCQFPRTRRESSFPLLRIRPKPWTLRPGLGHLADAFAGNLRPAVRRLGLFPDFPVRRSSWMPEATSTHFLPHAQVLSIAESVSSSLPIP
jgi:SCO1/SenC